MEDKVQEIQTVENRQEMREMRGEMCQTRISSDVSGLCQESDRVSEMWGKPRDWKTFFIAREQQIQAVELGKLFKSISERKRRSFLRYLSLKSNAVLNWDELCKNQEKRTREEMFAKLECLKISSDKGEEIDEEDDLDDFSFNESDSSSDE